MKKANCLFKLAMVIIITAALEPVVFGDEWSDTISDMRTTLSSIKHSVREIDLLEKNPTNSYYYTNIFELLYNQNHRDLALKLLALGETRVTDVQRILDARRILAYYELDLTAIEKAYREQIEEALSHNRIPEIRRFGLSSIASDPVFQQRIIPDLIQRAMEDTPLASLIYEFLQRNTRDKVQLLALKRQRLAVIPDDENAASGFANLAIEVNEYELLVSKELPESITKNSTLLYYKIQAYLALNRKPEALDTLAKAEDVLANAEFKNDFTWISEMYFKAGETEKAREVALKYGSSWPLDYAKALARIGDKDSVAACVKKEINKDSSMSPHIMIQLIDVCREVNLPDLAQSTFNEVERRIFNLKSIPNEINYFYKKEGLTARLIEKRLPLMKNERELQNLLNPLINTFEKELWPQALEMLTRHLKEYENNWIYQYTYARLLELLERPGEALSYYRKAATLQPPDALGMVNNPRPDDGVYRCLMAVKDYDTCEIFVKENMNGLLAIFYENTQQWDKAIHAYHDKKDYQRAFGLTLEHQGLDAAASYTKTIPAESRLSIEDFLLEARKDTAGLVTSARARVATNPNDPDLHAQLALRLFQANQITEAQREVRKAADLGELFQTIYLFSTSPNDKGGNMFTGNVGLYQIIPFYIENNILDQLETDLKSLITRSNAHKAGYLQRLGSYLSQTTQIDLAIDAYKQASTLDPYRTSMYREAIDTLRNK